MMRNVTTPQHPLAAIELGILNDEPVANLLRKVVILGGQTGSPALRQWATAELNGYGGDAEHVPDYRKVPAILALDAVVGYNKISGQQVSPAQMSAVLGFEVAERVSFREPIAELADLARRSDDKGVRFAPAWAQLAIAKIDQGQPFQQTYAIYWMLSASALVGIIDRVATKLADFVAELRTIMAPATDVPSAEAVNAAVGTIIISGGVNQFSVGAHSSVNGQKVDVKQGDLSSLKKQLTLVGVSESEWSELLVAMTADVEASDATQRSPIGQRTRAWLSRVTDRLQGAAGEVMVGAAGGTLGDLLTEALKAYHAVH